MVHEFTRINPGAPDFGGLLGWWEYTGKESGFEDFIHFGPMDTISAYGFDDGTMTGGPFEGNLAMWASAGCGPGDRTSSHDVVAPSLRRPW